MSLKPWTSGPQELIDHAIGHLKGGSPFDCRIAMISIDNAVELSIKTYLGLPKRVRGTDGPSRRELEDASSRFPDLLDLLEMHAEDKLPGVDLGDVEGYHRLRNTLYHDGNGVTVDPQHVDGYLQAAKVLVKALLGIDFETKEESPPTTKLGELILKWAALERAVRQLAAVHLPKEKSLNVPLFRIVDGLVSKQLVTGAYRSRLDKVAKARNSFVHGVSVPPENQLVELIQELDLLLGELPRPSTMV